MSLEPFGVSAELMRSVAAQVQESVRTYVAHLPLRSMVIFGGLGIQPQIDRLRWGVDAVVATDIAARGLDIDRQPRADVQRPRRIQVRQARTE